MLKQFETVCRQLAFWELRYAKLNAQDWSKAVSGRMAAVLGGLEKTDRKAFLGLLKDMADFMNKVKLASKGSVSSA